MSSSDVIANRAISAFGVSVGTSLALESIFRFEQPSIDPDRKIPQHVNIQNYDEFWINVATLFRNMIGALPKEGSNTVIVPDLAEALINEIAYINQLVEYQSSGKTQVIFYVCEYKTIDSMGTEYIHVRRDNTTNQKIYTALQNQSLQEVINKIGKGDNFRVFDTDINVTPKGNPGVAVRKSKALILTHIPYDLTSWNRFTTLDLIESHSGVLKKRSAWYTKYLNGKDLPNIPFVRGFIPVFGDKEQFSPMDIKLRKEIIEIAKANNWTQLTTLPKIKSNLAGMKNKFYLTILNTIL